MARVTYTRLPIAPVRRVLALRGAALIVAFLLCALFLVIAGRHPVDLAILVMRSTIGSRFGLEDLALYLTPLILTGCAVTVGLRIGLWNIGAEGQFYAGATAAAAVGLYVPGPAFILLPVMAVAALLAGMAWIAVPALARTWAGVSEIITTLLLNFVATLFVYYLATGPWADHVTGALASTERLKVAIPEFWGAVHLGFPLAVLVALALAYVMSATSWGYEVRFSGANQDSARYAGMKVRRRIMGVMMLSGALAGLAGMLEVAGTVHRLQGGIANNYGYLGIVVAVLANGSVLAVIPGALLMAFILDAGIVMQTAQISNSVVLAMTGLVLLLIAIADELACYQKVRPPAAIKQEKAQ